MYAKQHPAPVLSEDEDENKEEVPRRLYCADARQATNLKIVFTPRDLRPELAQRNFKPVLVHQIFGNSGIVYGYRNLSIDIYYLANSAKCFVDLKHTEIVNSDITEQIPDDIFQNLAAWLPEGYCTDIRKFRHAIATENHTKMYGIKVDTHQSYNELEEARYKYTITQCSASEPGFAEFHARFQCLLVWYIDAASQIDVDDPNWMFLYVYEQRRQPNGRSGAKYPVGFCTVYTFFHFPDKIRARISQLFILPPCQRTGLGTVLLKNAYKMILQLPNVIDITVEDPCPTFTKMRDLMDCQLLMQLECFKSPIIKAGLSKEMFEEANRQFKINKRQCRRIYEILRIVNVSSNDHGKEFQSIYLEIVERLEAPYTRDNKAIMKKRLKKEHMRDNNVYQPSCSASTVENNALRYLSEISELARYIISTGNRN